MSNRIHAALVLAVAVLLMAPRAASAQVNVVGYWNPLVADEDFIERVHDGIAGAVRLGQVLHAGSGPIHLLAAAVQLDTCVSMFVGPVASFYDVNRVSKAGEPLIRMTDEEWTRAVGEKSDFVVRPAWARPFLGP